jgi:hypothetical protein
MDLRVMATHPDRVGGLGLLAEASLGMAPVGFGIAAIGASGWAMQIARGAAVPGDFLQPAGAFVFILLALAFVPLVAFAPLLRRARFRFVREYGALAEEYAERFHDKWIAKKRTPDLLGSADLQSFADLANLFDVIRETRLLIFTKQSVVYVALSSILPLAPIPLMVMPLEELLLDVANMVL